MQNLVLLLLLLQSPLPSGDIVVSADPLLYDRVVAGAQAWNDTGYVNFVVIIGTCYEGHYTFCLKEGQGADPNHVALFKYPGRVIEVYNSSLFSAAFACQELGHVLGLHYHRNDYLSCMTNPLPTVAAPDAIDLANLGYVAPSPTTNPAQVTTLPSTGMGQTIRCYRDLCAS